ncbi:pentapeptide repeat-containing protein [Dactylosporangium sp. NPDC049525]|uniref:pentapeptide repeat-containing protein n=1 Tax=Dactylosporangium sp. NPDC049525 TaxID=3154730 RepID=UPI0034247EDA
MTTGDPPKPPRPMSTRAILAGAAIVVLIGAVLLVALLVLYGKGTPQDQAHLEAVRTAGATVIGTGGAVALLLAARRQRSTELTLEHQQQVAATAEQDAVERRVTELYAQAADQLGSEKAPVRLAGLYALERLGRLNPAQRETIISVVCAYLRMPFTSPGDRPADDALYVQFQERSQELQVRMTAERILRRHRGAAEPDDFWTVPVDLDGANLDQAHLPDVDLSDASLYRTDLTGAELGGANLGRADLTAAVLTGANLAGADLTAATLDDADLTATVLTGARLTGTLLTGATWSRSTVWPDDAVKAVIAAASTGDDPFHIGDLRLP